MAYSDQDFFDLRRALGRYVSEGLDQWAAWRFDTEHGPVYVKITRELPPDEPESAYALMSE